MPQLDFTSFVSQIFWLFIVFLSIYFLIAKIFTPNIRNIILYRQSVLKSSRDEASRIKELSEQLRAESELISNQTKIQINDLMNQVDLEIAEFRANCKLKLISELEEQSILYANSLEVLKKDKEAMLEEVLDEVVKALSVKYFSYEPESQKLKVER